MSKPSPSGSETPDGGDGDPPEVVGGEGESGDTDGQVWPSERLGRRTDGGRTARSGTDADAGTPGTGSGAGPGTPGERPDRPAGTGAATGDTADGTGTGGTDVPGSPGTNGTDARGEGGANGADPGNAADGEAADGDAPALRTLFLGDEEAGELISSLSSETARSILVRLHEGPATASEVADAVDTSVQNVRHHLDNLMEAGAVEVSGTRYSSKGREMNVYAATEDPLVVVVGGGDAGDDADADRGDDAGGEGFVDSLRRFLGAVGLLGVASLVVEALSRLATADAAAGIVRDPTAAVGTGAGPVGVPAGLLFFAGGAFLLAVVSAWHYRRAGAGTGDGAGDTDAGSGSGGA